jgi:PleD family two-component response regulator
VDNNNKNPCWPKITDRKYFYHRVSVIFTDFDKDIDYIFSRLEDHNLIVVKCWDAEAFLAGLSELQTDCVVFSYDAFKNERRIFEALKMVPRLMVVPVAVISSPNNSDEELLKVGVDDIIQWPIKKSHLILRLRTLSRLGDLEQSNRFLKA